MKSPPIAEIQVFYDSDCAFCVRSARVLRRLDRARRLQLTPLQRAAGAPGVPSQARLSESLHCVDRSGRWFRGGDACLRIAEEIPALQPLGRLGRLPVARQFVDGSYWLIAANRHRISRFFRDDACATDVAPDARDTTLAAVP